NGPIIREVTFYASQPSYAEVRILARSSDWHVSKLGLKVEFEVPDMKVAALEDDSGFGLLLQEGEISGDPAVSVTIYFEAANVDELHHRLEQVGIRFDHPPKKN